MKVTFAKTYYGREGFFAGGISHDIPQDKLVRLRKDGAVFSATADNLKAAKSPKDKALKKSPKTK